MSKSLVSTAIERHDSMAEISYMRTIRTPDEYERPIFKWVGGKFSELPIVLEHLPHGKRLIEPFVGGGSVFTNAGFRHNLLNDINWICPYISRHLLSLTPLQARCRRYSRGER